MEGEENPLLCIGLCTYQRPSMLTEALDSVAQLRLPSDINLKLLVCDNDAEASAREVVDSFRPKLSFPIEYLVEGNRGIVFARNRILDEALQVSATYVAFFDDDETIEPDWLVALLQCMEEFNADVVNGKVVFLWPEEVNLHVRLRNMLQRMHFPQTGEQQHGSGTGNVLFKTDWIREGHRFHPELNLRGGSDQLFFQQLNDKGARIVWCNEALAYEKVPLSRANREWLLKRRYRYGYNKFYILKHRFGLAHARKDSKRFCLKEFMWCISRAPFYPLGSEDFKIKWVARWLFAKGVWHGLQEKDYFEYQTVHGS